MQKLYTSARTRPGADCGSGHELLIAKFRLKLKKGTLESLESPLDSKEIKLINPKENQP